MLASEGGSVEGGIHSPPGINPHDCPHISRAESNSRLSKRIPHVIRLRLSERLPAYKDMVYGKVNSAKKGFAQDTILMKSDGWPTYHLACVIDDHLMKITHVVRGTEWTPSTPFHLMIYEALGWKPPIFGHVGLLTNVQGQKFSKRNADVDLTSFQKQGVLPVALDNFVALLGWSHTCKEDFMTPQQLIENFSTKFTKGDVKVQFDKLWFLQRKHAIEVITKAISSADLERDMIAPLLAILQSKKSPITTNYTPEEAKELVYRLLKLDMRNWTNAQEFVERHTKTFSAPTAEELTAADSSIVKAGHLEHRATVPASVPPTVRNSEVVSIAQQLPALLGKHADKSVDEQFKLLNVDFMELMTPCVEKQVADLGEVLEEKDKEDLKKSWVAMVHKYLKWAIVVDVPGPDALKLMLVLGTAESMRRLELAEKMAIEPGGAILS